MFFKEGYLKGCIDLEKQDVVQTLKGEEVCVAETNKVVRTQLCCCFAPHPLPFLEDIADGGGCSRSLWTVVPSSIITGSENMFIVKIRAGINNICKKEVVVAFFS